MQEHSIPDVLSKVFKDDPIFQKGGEELLFKCPKCDHHKKKLNINIVSGYYHCWVCDFKGKGFVSLLKNINAPKNYYSYFKNDKYYKKQQINTSKENTRVLELPPEFNSLISNKSSLQVKPFLNYCKMRNISETDIFRYNIGYCTSGLFKNKLIVPSYDSNQKLNFYCGRDIYDTNYKYQLCDHSKNMIGFESLINFNKQITLTEGVFDAISIRYNAIPLFGTIMPSNLKIELIKHHPPVINVVLDNDAEEKAIQMCDFLMKNNLNVKFVKLNEKDPNKLGFKKIWQIINSTALLTESELFKEKIRLKI